MKLNSACTVEKDNRIKVENQTHVLEQCRHMRPKLIYYLLVLFVHIVLCLRTLPTVVFAEFKTYDPPLATTVARRYLIN